MELNSAAQGLHIGRMELNSATQGLHIGHMELNSAAQGLHIADLQRISVFCCILLMAGWAEGGQDLRHHGSGKGKSLSPGTDSQQLPNCRLQATSTKLQDYRTTSYRLQDYRTT